jgi:prefoldin subunit 5
LEKKTLEEYNKQFTELVEEVKKLEKKKQLLQQEISSLETEKDTLEKLKQELRSNILKG